MTASAADHETAAAQPLIREIMSGDPAVIAPDATVMQAATVMSGRNIGAVVVCDAGGVVGILTERDLLRAAARGCRPDAIAVADLMTANPLTIAAEATWTAAAELMMARGVRHLPVVADRSPVGMLSVRDLMEHRSRHLEWLVQERTAALQETNAALRERERVMQFHLDVAGRIQQSLLPAELPTLPSLELEVAFHPLDQVSGDYYDFAMLPSGHLGILVADATGHGVPAAFVSVMAKTAFHAYAQGIESPASVLATMNRRLVDLMETERYITMFYGVVDQKTLRLTYALAAHPRPLWYRASTGQVEKLEGEGTLIGFMPQAQFPERSVQLAPGDVVLIYTDGVTEAGGPSKIQYGQERLAAFLQAHAGAARGDLLSQLDADLAAFRGGEPIHDDITCISLNVHQG